MTRGSLARRLYALGLLQLAVLGAVAAALVWATRPAPPRRGTPGRLVADARTTLAPALDRPAALERQLRALARRGGVELSVYDEDGTLLGTTAEPPIALDPSLHPGPYGPLGLGHPGHGAPGRGPHGPGPDGDAPHGTGHHGPPPPEAFGPPPLPGLPPPAPPVFAVRLQDGPRTATLMMRFAPRLPPWSGPLLTLLAGLVVIGIGAILTARWIARPLDRLARTARALGDGDLAARTGLARGDEIGAVARSFDEMAARIERQIQTERELLGNVSHELRTPLARIRVAMDLAGEGDAEAARTALAEIATDLGELETIVDDILLALRLDVAGSRQDPFARSRTEVDVRALAERAAERFRARHPGRPLVLEVPASLPPVLVDDVIFRRALDNLLDNAHKYSPDPDAPVTLAVGGDAAATTFRVSDRGAGIAAEDLPHVFDAFFRAERSRTRGEGGVGLGLTLARRIVRAHGGDIAIASDLGRGTSVTITLPRAPRPGAPARPSPAGSPRGAEPA